MNRPNQNVVTAAYFGQADERARITACGTYAPVQDDGEIIVACRAMSCAFTIWKIFTQAAPSEVAAEVRALN